MLLMEDGRVVRKSSETDSIKFKISSKTSRGKKDSTKDTIIDITSDSQVNSNFPNRKFFLHELRACHIHVKVGEKVLFSAVAC